MLGEEIEKVQEAQCNLLDEEKEYASQIKPV